MAILQPLIDLVELCHLHGVTNAVISPGSRSAVLTLALARNPHIQCTVVMDERAAGFVALGMAQQLGKPVVLVCTSGSAAYNFAPAITEAYFQQIPLLILTADRPNEWIHQNDGQTIYQSGIYGRHVKASYELPADYVHPDASWYINRITNEALLTSLDKPRGPVHINVPIREPFYPQATENFIPSANLRVIEKIETLSVLPDPVWHSLLDEWENADKILIAVGQYTPGGELKSILTKLTEEFQIPVLGEILGNLAVHEQSLMNHELILGSWNQEILQPDLLITLGGSFLSKNLKKFLRELPPRNHWHISEDSHVIDPFQTITRQIKVSPEYFFPKLFEDVDYLRFVQNDEGGQDEEYLAEWVRAERYIARTKFRFLDDLTSFNDLSAVYFLLKNMPYPAQLHVANSMPIRYASIMGMDRNDIIVYANRGTSGIDGCVSTAIGSSLLTTLPVYLLVGDVAFFYDRNGLLISNLPPNLKIVLLNNSGGTIFRMIEGPASQPELEEYFETRHAYTAVRTAQDSSMLYWAVEEMVELQSVWTVFVEAEKPALLEIRTDPVINAEVFRQLKQSVRIEK
ncbi:2-succinyl-5-enolpyruvyl-6-hydroxy-3-cyclohexene-1-carboxylic-acid synthase [Salmonirosea aquatica]|uniref:2-succinyl-5-enolpyruvyl-6-hydroxy-3-cyclohexene-1-carboxylate synthase n=1 Tax=Salmonirosea aquatica TaxID=2654236 RepID=A0A7C9BKL5_9BACT|nr:2-succinyl-5-enolpyruvyl-6-hydroxy-3-cyclohexene-1-carboxylic-acid synthase [Cytophagaceae bacterium SJW1-29]